MNACDRLLQCSIELSEPARRRAHASLFPNPSQLIGPLLPASAAAAATPADPRASLAPPPPVLSSRLRSRYPSSSRTTAIVRRPISMRGNQPRFPAAAPAPAPAACGCACAWAGRVKCGPATPAPAPAPSPEPMFGAAFGRGPVYAFDVDAAAEDEEDAVACDARGPSASAPAVRCRRPLLSGDAAEAGSGALRPFDGWGCESVSPGGSQIRKTDI